MKRREFLAASPRSACPRAAKAAHLLGVAASSSSWTAHPFLVRSGEMHYPRVPRAYWRDRMRKMRAMGLNTLCTYVFWNLHEPQQGKFDFSGNLDIAEYVRAAQAEGLYVLLRPGPYICTEWDFGGLPWWLLANPVMKVAHRRPAISARRGALYEPGRQTTSPAPDPIAAAPSSWCRWKTSTAPSAAITSTWPPSAT